MENIKQLIINGQDNIPEKEIFKALSKDVLDELNVDLVSIWYFTENNSKLTCQYSVDRFDMRDLSGVALRRADFPSYFSAIIEGVSISADDVYSNPTTNELIEAYLKPNNIKSLLDYIIYKADSPIGLICCETTSGFRAWTSQDIDYVRALTVMAGVELKNPKIN